MKFYSKKNSPPLYLGEGKRYSRKDLNKFRDRILQTYQTKVDNLRKAVDLDNLKFGEGNVVESLRSKIRKCFDKYLRSIWEEKKPEYFSKVPHFETESKATLKEASSSKLWGKFPDFKSKEGILWRMGLKKYSSSEAEKAITDTTYQGKTLLDTLKEGWKSEKDKAKKDIAKWINEEGISILKHSAIEKLKDFRNKKIERSNSEIEKIKKERERIKKILEFLLSAKEKFEELDQQQNNY